MQRCKLGKCFSPGPNQLLIGSTLIDISVPSCLQHEVVQIDGLTLPDLLRSSDFVRRERDETPPARRRALHVWWFILASVWKQRCHRPQKVDCLTHGHSLLGPESELSPGELSAMPACPPASRERWNSFKLTQLPSEVWGLASQPRSWCVILFWPYFSS